jgi:8-oxo-dGTP pyrophosphatase MutT (NUDIX family)
MIMRRRLLAQIKVRYVAGLMHVSEYDARALRRVLDQSPLVAVEGPSAAVAVVFRSGASGTELLFIQRATKDTDPWSGHMAFPGGRTDPEDADSHATAERETSEEVDLDLKTVDRLGSLQDLVPGRHLQVVHAQAYWLDGERPKLTANYEVADTVWVPLSDLADHARYIDYYYEASNSSWPGIQLDTQSQVVWGLTLRFLADLFTRLETPFIEILPWPKG